MSSALIGPSPINICNLSARSAIGASPEGPARPKRRHGTFLKTSDFVRIEEAWTVDARASSTHANGETVMASQQVTWVETWNIFVGEEFSIRKVSQPTL